MLKTTATIKTKNIPLESPIKLPLEMQEKNLNFSKFVGFWRLFLENKISEKWLWFHPKNLEIFFAFLVTI